MAFPDADHRQIRDLFDRFDVNDGVGADPGCPADLGGFGEGCHEFGTVGRVALFGLAGDDDPALEPGHHLVIGIDIVHKNSFS